MPSNSILLAAEVASKEYDAPFNPRLNDNFNIIGATSFAGGFEAIAYRSTVDNTVYVGFGGSGDTFVDYVFDHLLFNIPNATNNYDVPAWDDQAPFAFYLLLIELVDPPRSRTQDHR